MSNPRSWPNNIFYMVNRDVPATLDALLPRARQLSDTIISVSGGAIVSV